VKSVTRCLLPPRIEELLKAKPHPFHEAQSQRLKKIGQHVTKAMVEMA